jgi:hypothetical protein
MINRRRASLGAVVLSGAVLMAAPGANATCALRACVAAPSHQLAGVDPGDGVLCTYVKMDEPAPEGVNSTGGAPYVFTRSESWRYSHPGQYTTYVCYPACTIDIGRTSVACRVSSPGADVLPDPTE